MDAYNIAESMESISMMSSNMDEFKNESFNFPSLPYVCQKRFAETLDVKTLKTFATINFSTFNLSKRCHTIKRAEIIEDDCHFTLSCSCNENEFCKGAQIYGFSASSKIIKMDVLETIKVVNSQKENIDSRYLQYLPINFDSTIQIELQVKCIEFDVLKSLIMSNGLLKSFVFDGGIKTTGSIDEFINFFKNLSHLDEFYFSFDLLLLPFNLNDLINQFTMLGCERIIDLLSLNQLSFVIIKSSKLQFL